jgi:hypothetical protein
MNSMLEVLLEAMHSHFTCRVRDTGIEMAFGLYPLDTSSTALVYGT